MEHHHAALQVRAAQVRIQLRQARRQHHALVADAVGGQADDVERRHVLQALGGAAARQVKRAAEAVRGRPFALDIDQGPGEHLFDARHVAARGGAAGVGIDRQGAPAGHRQLHLGQCRAQGVAAARGVGLERARVGGEVLAGPELGRVHEDRDDHAVRAAARVGDEREVPRVQRTHRRHEPDEPGRAQRAESLAQLADRPDRLHLVSAPAPVRMPGTASLAAFAVRMSSDPDLTIHER